MMRRFAGVSGAQRADEQARASPAPDPQNVSRQIARAEGGEDTSHAQRIVKELYLRYQKQLQRWKDYRNLFFFLSFVALFLAILYTQRQANTAFKVHSTLEDVLVPQDDTMGSTDEVYRWLKTILQTVWVDPKCGDGICESPFEFASYSRFGCRADCGKLQDVQNLTTVQVDVYFDFSHPIGSIPASDLMQQAQYNLCPVTTAYSGACYYDKDNTFDRLSGSTTSIITDMPDGDWELVMRRDIFMKTRGAVRDLSKLNAVSYYYRVYLAAVSALAEQNTEMMLLNQAVQVAGQSLMTFIGANIMRISATNETDAKFQIRQYIVATCGCNGVPKSTVNATEGDWGPTNILTMFNNSVGGITDYTRYRSEVCNPMNAVGATFEQYKPRFVMINGTNTTFNDIETATNKTDFCNRVLANLTSWGRLHTNTTQRLMIDLRLGDSRTTGKIAARNAVYSTLRNFIILNMPELFDPIFTTPRGLVALQDMPNARMDVLQDAFVLGTTYAQQPQPAMLNITRRVIYNPAVTQMDMAARATPRIAEVRQQQKELLSAVVVPADTRYPKYGYPAAVTIEQLIQAFHAAMGSPDSSAATCTAANRGCTPVLLSDDITTLFLPNASMPDANNTALNATVWNGPGLQTDYNLVTWKGNNTAYIMCNLDLRGPQYVGQCLDNPVTCQATNNDSIPYVCTDPTTSLPVPGNLSMPSYREKCEMPCDQQLDCSQLCECYGACGTTQQCVCDACLALTRNAAADEQFVDITATATSAGRNAATIADLSTVAGGTGRRLQQTDTAVLNAVLTQVSSVQSQQQAIATQMTTLQQQVTKANQLAEARANDNRLIDLIQAGRQDIQAGQARVEAKLDDIIGKQNQSLATAEASLAALNAIQGLAQKQLAAQQALERAVQNQLSAIKTATYAGVISLTQALALWKRARRDRAVTLKAALLANVPCTMVPSASYDFNLDNGNVVDNTTARERNIGLTNRVISGMLLHQYRTNDTNCTDSKFNKIQQTCTGPTTLRSFGVDPVFKLGTTLYNPDKDDINGTIVVQYYNCSELASPTFNVPFQNMTTNLEPYCAELYNSQGLPYAFHHFSMDDKEPGFPVFFDINLSSDSATTWETYLEEGLFLDQHTRGLTAELVTYNAPLRIFGYFFIEFFFSDGGSIKLTHRLHTVRVELYSSSEDKARFAFEIILTMWIFGMLLHTVWQMLVIQKEKKNFLKFFAHGWNWVDFISNGLLTACMIVWWVFVTRYAKTFDTSLRHDVYSSLTPDANFLALNQVGAGLTAAWSDIRRLRNLIDLLNWYFALNGINILLLIARVLKLMDFQPRLGVVTRSLWLAGPDLIHFAIVAGMVFIGYAMMAHLIFGNAILKFQTFGESVNTCFEILLGNIDVNNELRALGGLQSVAGALFFWSYELLVFMVLLNFLLAIIVDAFSEVKEKTQETVGIHTELYQLMRDKWRSLMGSCSTNYISDAKLGTLLKQWAGDDKEEEKALQQAEVQKLLTILNEDLDEEDLRNVLMECLKDAPNQQDAKPAPRSGLTRFLPRRQEVLATPHEVSQAARYIVDRFGVPVEAEEEVLGGEEEAQDVRALAGAGLRSHGSIDPVALAAIDKEREQLASALERLAEVQRELADGQRNLMNGQRQLAEQQAKLVGLMHTDGGGPSHM